jgi:hypothetical protein
MCFSVLTYTKYICTVEYKVSVHCTCSGGAIFVCYGKSNNINNNNNNNNNFHPINMLFDIQTYSLTKKYESYMGNDVSLAQMFISNKS